MKTGFSPIEQYSTDSCPDTRADIYSLRTLIYYALTGRTPKSPYQRLADDRAFLENTRNTDSGLWDIIQKAAAVMPDGRYQNAEEFRDALSKLGINAAPIPIPKDYTFLKIMGTAPFAPVKRRTKAKHFLIGSVITVCAVIAISPIVGGHSDQPAKSPEPQKIELVLDDEYKGHFNIGGTIPAAQLQKFNSGVQITLHIEPWEEMSSDNIHGIIPVNADDISVLPYLTSPEELWADENDWINIEKGNRTVSLVISREGIESLGDGALGFETYNLIITSAVLEASKPQGAIRLNSYHKNRNAPYHVNDGIDGMTITAALRDFRLSSWGAHESQSIPKSAFYAFDGDVKVTLELEAVDDGMGDWRVIHVCNFGYCFNVFDDDFLVPALTDFSGKALVVRDGNYGICPDISCDQCVFIIPQGIKAKMTEGIFFQTLNVRVTSACLEAYHGEYPAFVEERGQ